ncbi:MAG: hypothetical protein ACSHXI_11890 [Hoeflea sp.]|uniref:hypothetical protein n=1 Tax=Hoeflea sp. TaxID=1940281 RepID=UPI003EF910A5
MNSVIRTALAALIVATAGVATSATGANAGGIGFELSIDGAGGGVIVREYDRRGEPGRFEERRDGRDRFEEHRGGRDRFEERRGDWDRFEDHRGGRGRDVCRTGEALWKAGEMGLRRAEIVRAGRNRIVVEGFRRHRPVRVAFANERRCPVIGWDR